MNAVAWTGAGYRIERIHVAEQAYTSSITEDLRETADPTDRIVQFGWDWRPLAPRRFEVVVEIVCKPISIAPESARVRIFGVFTADPGAPALSFGEFLRFNALAILFPYAREVISTMTGRGPYGAFHLNPLNLRALMKDFDISTTQGAEFLRAHPELAAEFGLEYQTRTELAEPR